MRAVRKRRLRQRIVVRASPTFTEPIIIPIAKRNGIQTVIGLTAVELFQQGEMFFRFLQIFLFFRQQIRIDEKTRRRRYDVLLVIDFVRRIIRAVFFDSTNMFPKIVQ